jgi:hypothetical protein
MDIAEGGNQVTVGGVVRLDPIVLEIRHKRQWDPYTYVQKMKTEITNIVMHVQIQTYTHIYMYACTRYKPGVP